MVGRERLFLVVCEGSSDFALLEGVIQQAGRNLGENFQAELIAPSPDATGSERRFGWSRVKDWCQGNHRRIGAVLTLRPADAFFIHMDTDIAGEIQQDGEYFSEDTGMDRRRWCECAMNQWIGVARSGVHWVLPTYQIETWLLATFDAHTAPPDFAPLLDRDYQEIPNVEEWLLKAGFKEDRKRPGRVYKEETLYRKDYLQTLLNNVERVRRRCAEFDLLQQTLARYAAS